MRLRRNSFFSALMLVLSSGCAAPRAVPPPELTQLASADSHLAVARSDLPNNLAQLLHSPLSPAAADQHSATPVRNILVLSGGGRDGAYSAGVLAGWSAAGSRPPFDVVTGISTGALIAPLAFLGARYDQYLSDSYTKVHTEDIYRRRPYLSLLWSESFADSAPLRHRIEAQVTDAFLAEIAQAHAAGRRLYVGTTNLDTGRLVLWDLGAIAAGTDPDKRELFQKILLASCSIPGLLPPVPINIDVHGKRYTELHVDGGVSASMFLTPYMALGDQTGARTNVYVIVAGKLSSEPRSVERRLIAVSGESLQKLLTAQTRGDLLRTFLLTRLTGGHFAVTSVPQELAVTQDNTRFNMDEMRNLFDAGYARATDGTAWRSTPPGVSPEEWAWPRTGTSFNPARVKNP